jgi:hypothetical protein
MNNGSRARSSAASSDATSVRRIGEALLMAQNRARVSTERANRSERYDERRTKSSGAENTITPDMQTDPLIPYKYAAGYVSILRTVLSQINLQSGVLLHELEEYPRTMSFGRRACLSWWGFLESAS